MINTPWIKIRSPLIFRFWILITLKWRMLTNGRSQNTDMTSLTWRSQTSSSTSIRNGVDWDNSILSKWSTQYYHIHNNHRLRENVISYKPHGWHWRWHRQLPMATKAILSIITPSPINNTQILYSFRTLLIYTKTF